MGDTINVIIMLLENIIKVAMNMEEVVEDIIRIRMVEPDLTADVTMVVEVMTAVATTTTRDEVVEVVVQLV